MLSRGPARPASRPNYVTARAANIRAHCNTSSHPDPDGFHAPNAPILFSMGGLTSVGNFSPLTTSDTDSLQGGSTQRSHIITQHSSETSQHPSRGASVLSSITGSTLPPSLDSSDSTTQAPPTPPVVPAIPIAPTITIKDKPSDLGIKLITNKDSWTDAKKIIDSRLRRAPYWPGASKELVTTNANAAASVWWEEVIVFYCQPPVSNLFVEERCFDGKGFKMIAHMDQNFNPLGKVDLLGYIFDLIKIRQSDTELVVTLKAWFSCLFSALKMGGINIDSAIQVGFMLRWLLAKYQAVIQEFCLGRHALTEVTLQTVVEQCNNYDKDPWKGPIGKDGKPARTPSANTAGTDPENPYELLSGKSLNYHFSQWKKALKDQKGKCMVCFGTARNPDHKTCNCPILKNLGFKLEKRIAADNPP
jgi:hypothetical protein